jgi:3-oxoacyl-[acyl-carrier-protein] synthase-3
MQARSSSPAGILGVGFYVPDEVVSNHDLVRRGLQTSDDWIVAHTGIRERRIAAPAQATSDLGAEAARRALDHAGVAREDIDLVVCATSTPDHLLPATASLIQHQLGLRAGAFDVNAACSGFVHALSVGFALQESARFRHVLVVAADTYSRFIDWQDRASAIFFGDGAAAAVLGPSSEGSWLLSGCQGSDGARASMITIVAGGSRFPADLARLEKRETTIRMQGPRVRDFVIDAVPAAIRRVVAAAQLGLSDIALVIPHQANARLIEACGERLELEPRRLFVNVDRYANTAAASVGIALAEAVQSGQIERGSNVVLVGFGGGLSWAALCLRWGLCAGVKVPRA